MDIRKMTLSDISDVVRIHTRVLPTTTARFGLLPFFYQTIINNPHLHVALVATEKNHVIGAMTATRDAHKTQALLFHPVKIIRAFFSLRVPLSELLERIWTERKIMAIAKPFQTLLTLCVDEKHQKKGVGKALVAAVPFTGTLYVDTENAYPFYERCGFRFFTKIRNSTVAVKTLNTTP